MELRLIRILFLLILCLNYSDAKIVPDSLNAEIANFIQENFQASDIDYTIEEIRKTKISSSNSRQLVDNLINIVERYVYLDIMKNPPQPKENYFNTVDLVEKLKNVNTEERPVYDIFRDINLIISECQDLHFSFDYNKEITNGYKLGQMFLYLQ